MLRSLAGEVEKLDEKAMRALAPILNEARRELRSDLTHWIRNIKDGDLRFTAQEYRRALLSVEKSMQVIGDTRPALRGILENVGDEAGRLAVKHVEFEVARMSQIFGSKSLGPMATQIDTAAVLAVGKRELIPRYETSAFRYSQAIRDDLKKQLGVGLAKGETFNQMTNRLQRMGGPRGVVALKGIAGQPGAVVENITEGLFRRYRHWGERIVRTETINAYNVQHTAGLDEYNDDLQEGEEPLGKRWDAYLDMKSGRTCELCRTLDGQMVDAGERFKMFGGEFDHPPAHPNCRCTVVAWSKEWGDVKSELPPVKAPPTKNRKPKGRPRPDPTPDTKAEHKAKRKKRTAKPIEQDPKVKQVTPLETQTNETMDLMDRSFRSNGWTDARKSIDQQFMARGYTETPRFSAKTRVMKRMKQNVLGYHIPNTARAGEITIRADVAEQMRSFVRRYKQSPNEVRQGIAKLKPDLEERARLISRMDKAEAAYVDAKIKASKAYGTDAYNKLEKAARAKLGPMRKIRTAINDKNASIRESPYAKDLLGADSMRTFYHEVLHGYGSSLHGTYRGTGMVVEEVTTEVLARLEIMKRFGVPRAYFSKGGSYGKFIDPVTDTISDAYGITNGKARRMLEKVADGFKKAKVRTSDPSRYTEQFLELFPEAKGKDLKEIKNKIRATLRGKK